MRDTILAHRYANAFVRISSDKEETSQWFGQLKNFSQRLSTTPLLWQALVHPAIPLDKKRELLEKLTQIPLIRRLVIHLTLKKRLRFLPEIVRHAQDLIDKKGGIARAFVRTASQLSLEQREGVAESLKVFFSRPILIEEKVAPELIAGMTIQVGDTILDNSLKGQLQLLEKQLCIAFRGTHGNSS